MTVNADSLNFETISYFRFRFSFSDDVAFVIAMHVVANTMKGKTLPLTTPEDVRLKIKEIMVR